MPAVAISTRTGNSMRAMPSRSLKRTAISSDRIEPRMTSVWVKTPRLSLMNMPKRPTRRAAAPHRLQQEGERRDQRQDAEPADQAGGARAGIDADQQQQHGRAAEEHLRQDDEEIGCGGHRVTVAPARSRRRAATPERARSNWRSTAASASGTRPDRRPSTTPPRSSARTP